MMDRCFLQAHQCILQIIAILSVLHCLLQKISNSTEYKLKYVMSIKNMHYCKLTTVYITETFCFVYLCLCF